MSTPKNCAANLEVGVGFGDVANGKMVKMVEFRILNGLKNLVKLGLIMQFAIR